MNPWVKQQLSEQEKAVRGLAGRRYSDEVLGWTDGSLAETAARLAAVVERGDPPRGVTAQLFAVRSEQRRRAREKK